MALPISLMLALAGSVLALPSQQHTIATESRSLDHIYEAALAEGGVVTAWHGGDEKNQQDSLKTAFETRFPGMTLNLTVDLSKYHDGNIDHQLAANDLYVDTAILQTLHDYPRWKEEGVLLQYKPRGFDKVYSQFKDPQGYYTGMFVFAWSNIWNTEFVQGTPPKEYTDYLKPEYKDKLVLTYPNDDDAVLYQFDLIVQRYGYDWFLDLIQQNPRWVRGTGTPATLLSSSNGTYLATFTSSVGLIPPSPFNISFPTEADFTTWPQTAAIFKDAPHPEAAKLFLSFMLSPEHQKKTGTWSVRSDVEAPAGYPAIMNMPSTNTARFKTWMMDRRNVERLRFWYEDKLGTAQGLSPLIDDL